MERIIDLKNKKIASAPQNESPFDVEPKEYHPETSVKNSPTDRIITWSGQLHQRPNVAAIFVAAMIFFAIAALVQIFQKNIITTVFFALVGAVILLNSNRKPDVGRFEINPSGILINDLKHIYSEIKSFWIEYDQELGIQELSLQLKRWYSPYIKIPIYGQNPVQLRLALLEFLPEIEHKDSMVEILSRKLGI